MDVAFVDMTFSSCPASLLHSLVQITEIEARPLYLAPRLRVYYLSTLDLRQTDL